MGLNGPVIKYLNRYHNARNMLETLAIKMEDSEHVKRSPPL